MIPLLTATYSHVSLGQLTLFHTSFRRRNTCTGCFFFSLSSSWYQSSSSKQSNPNSVAILSTSSIGQADAQVLTNRNRPDGSSSSFIVSNNGDTLCGM
mmetsp:Transcript_3771/g.6422  ORF Transcript_3771/g.6422 Transcript_3771/m.6422 type:complete len:98 (+) Transcript_3771:124-417(+)